MTFKKSGTDTETTKEAAKETKSKKLPAASAQGLMYTPGNMIPMTRAPGYTFTLSITKDTDDPRPGRSKKLVTKNVEMRAGLNVLPADDITMLEENFPLVFARGALKVLDLGDAVGSDGQLQNLLGLRKDAAQSVAYMETNRRLLQTWAKDETREIVQTAIQAQITKLEKATQGRSATIAA